MPERVNGEFQNLGPQITATTLIGTTFAKEPSGREIICTVMRGQPAKLLVYDLRSGELLHKLALEGADGAWNATTASDGIVYVGTDANGHLYRYVPGEDRVTDLGVVPPDKWVWDLCPGEDSEVFIATYPGCRIVRYHPKDGFKEVSNGPAAENENYARSVTRDAKTGKIYVGVGSHAHLIEIDPKTGAKNDLLPTEHLKEEFVYGVEVLGDRLFGYVTHLGKSLVFNLRTRQIETWLPAMSGQQVMTKSPNDERVWYAVGGKLYAYDMSTPNVPPAAVMDCPNVLGFSWTKWEGADFPGESLVIFAPYAQRIIYNPQTGKSVSKVFDKPKEPIVIQSIAVGPDGKIWTGGYLSGGNATYDPATGKSEELKGLSQAESMAALGDVMYFGNYPNGRFNCYDTTRPWDGKQKNPREIGKIEGQSRPFAALGVKELNKVYWGTVPEYGLLGGGIAEFDPTTDKLEFYPEVVPKQAIIALAYRDGLIVGGSTISGGLGMKPSEKEGKLFLWDPKTRQKVFEMTPVEGAPAVTSVINGPDGKIWGVAGSTLFIFDWQSRKVISKHDLFEPEEKNPTHIWRGAFLVVHPSGQVYGTHEGRLFQIDPTTMKLTVLREKKDMGLLMMDRRGQLYFRDKVNLWRYTPAKS
jgi:streptogramin lyase